MARVQRASAPAPALQWPLRIPLDPRPSAVASQLQARQQVATPSAAVPETEHLLLLAAHCLLSSNGDLPRHKPLACLLRVPAPLLLPAVCCSASGQATLTLGHLLQRRLSPAPRVVSALHRRSPIRIRYLKATVHGKMLTTAPPPCSDVRARQPRGIPPALPPLTRW